MECKRGFKNAVIVGNEKQNIAQQQFKKQHKPLYNSNNSKAPNNNIKPKRSSGKYYSKLFTEQKKQTTISTADFVWLVVSSSLIHSAARSQSENKDGAKTNKKTSEFVVPYQAPKAVHPCVLWSSGITPSLSSHAHPGCTALDYLSTLRRSSVLCSLEEFWQQWIDIARQANPFNASSGECSCHLFLQGITPLWEDPINQEGGKFSFVLKNETESELHRIWFALVVSLFYDLLGPGICGIVFQMRKFGAQFTVWNRSVTRGLEETSSMLSCIIGKPLVNISYIPHRVVRSFVAHAVEEAPVIEEPKPTPPEENKQPPTVDQSPQQVPAESAHEAPATNADLNIEQTSVAIANPDALPQAEEAQPVEQNIPVPEPIVTVSEELQQEPEPQPQPPKSRKRRLSTKPSSPSATTIAESPSSPSVAQSSTLSWGKLISSLVLPSVLLTSAVASAAYMLSLI